MIRSLEYTSEDSGCKRVVLYAVQDILAALPCAAGAVCGARTLPSTAVRRVAQRFTCTAYIDIAYNARGTYSYHSGLDVGGQSRLKKRDLYELA